MDNWIYIVVECNSQAVDGRVMFTPVATSAAGCVCWSVVNESVPAVSGYIGDGEAGVEQKQKFANKR